MLIPKDNESDLYEVDEEVKKTIRFQAVSDLAQVLKAALIRPAHKAPRPVVTVPPATQLIAADAGAPKEPATVM